MKAKKTSIQKVTQKHADIKHNGNHTPDLSKHRQDWERMIGVNKGKLRKRRREAYEIYEKISCDFLMAWE
jgi:hypothetical protein